ncbi:insulin-degrading enzyme [Pluteus cervinus]|uniref:Insulin-degrading enzyme n=1 Tax=Pluteus cervinus TaxID=181527 RepID=A0ACD3BDT8_9AGAR|nr:insulin-degrading enzyme [Pluteus cervinus]
MATETAGAWERVTPTDTTPSFQVFMKPIQKSPQDDRQYRIIQLDNGIQATLIHDANADKAAASLDVAVGHLYDPDDMPGLAHFCEHMLFLGTEKFPVENEYSDYLAKNNGASNAYTATSNTNYHFSVSTHALPGALERFAAFFHCPVFSPSGTSRELSAVDSEHKKNHQTDIWRIFQLNKHLSRPGHVWSKFGSGSRESLSKTARAMRSKGRLSTGGSSATPQSASLAAPSPIPSRISSPAPSVTSNTSETDADGGVIGREVRRRLIDWWTNEYCASRMRLCIVGKESLDELGLLTSKLFSPIPNRGKEPLPMIREHPFGPNEKGTLIQVQTVMAFHALEISFPSEYQPPHWKYKPTHFISHFVGHEGPGSLFSYLKNKGWVTSLSCGPQHLARGFAMFKATIYMTQEGFLHYRDVVLATFKYLSMLRSTTFEQYHQREVARMSAIRFQFAEKRRPDDYAIWISEHMNWPLPRELLISGPQVTWEWDDSEEARIAQRKVKEYLDSFRIDESRVVLMAKAEEHAKLGDGEWVKEPWYGTEYRVERFDEKFKAEANSLDSIPELYLPGPNKFIPTDLDVDRRCVSEPLKRPHLIRETPLSTLWYKRDDRFWVPKAHVVIDLRSHACVSSVKAAVLTRLYTDLVTDSLTEFSYDADLAGLSYNLIHHTSGFMVAMQGYNDKMEVLARHTQERIKSLTIRPDRFNVMKELARRDWQNFLLNQSYTLSDFYCRHMLCDQQWTPEEKLRELPAITVDDVRAHIKDVLSQANLRILATGNIFKDSAIRLAEIAEAGLSPSPLSTVQLNDRALLLPHAGEYIWTAPVPNPNQANSALTYYVHYGTISDQRLRITAALLTQILSEPAFNVLRTKEQLGYIVSCGSWLLPGASERGLRIVIQSEKNPRYLESRVDAFLDEMRFVLETMTPTVFEQHRIGLQKKWLEADKNLADEAGRFIAHINSGHWDFLRNENDAKTVEGITKDDVLALFMSHVHPSSSTRSKLSVHLQSQKPRPPQVSSAAAQAFAVQVRGAVPDLGDLDSPLDSENPTLVEFVTHWRSMLANYPNSTSLFATLPQLVEQYPVAGEGNDTTAPGATIITDFKAFKASLRTAEVFGPMVHWNDLPTSKF